jgi:Holliday junction DNA helicase RuvB
MEVSRPEKKGLSGVAIERFVAPDSTEIDVQIESATPSIRPQKFADYPGQDSVKSNLKVYVEASRLRRKTLDHVILHGPPGLGKTTLAHIVASELGVPFHATSGPAIDKPGDLAGILAGLEPGALLFVDEIHRLSIKVEEILYSAMEDFAIDVLIGQGPTARSVRMPLSPFTLVGATTRLSLMSRPLLSRFGIQERLEFYDDDALVQIIDRSAKILGVKIDKVGALEIARRSRGTPRLANRFLKRVWDFASVEGDGLISGATASASLARQGMDEGGLDRIDRGILKVIIEQYDGGPVGIETLAASLNEDSSTIEDVYEPFLVYKGYLARGPRGRSITATGRQHIERFGALFKDGR